MLEERIQIIEEVLGSGDWSSQVRIVEDVVALLAAGKPDYAEFEGARFIDMLADPDRKWEVRVALARTIPRLPQRWALHVAARLEGDTNPYVRKALLRSRRQRTSEPAADISDGLARTIEQIVANHSNAGRKGDEALATALRSVAVEGYTLALAEFAHELKNIIQMVTGPAGSVRRHLEGRRKDRAIRSLAMMEKGTEALRSFSENLNWSARGRELVFCSASLLSVVHDVKSSVSPADGVAIRVAAVKDCDFDTVPERLVRALANILRNAVEAVSALPGPGLVDFDAFLTAGGDEVEFVIADTGPGVHSDDREDCFRLGSSGKKAKGNIGMGLYVARKVIEYEHGGAIKIEDAKPRGAVFRMRIPRRQG